MPVEPFPDAPERRTLLTGSYTVMMSATPVQRVLLGIGLAGAVLSATAHAGAQEAARVFQAGAATSNITPKLGTSINGNMRDVRAQHVHDELHARCLVLDDGKTRVAFAVVDACMLPRTLTDEARRLVQDEAGISQERILISATHSHSGGTCASVFQSDPDPEYPKYVARKVADGIRRATNNLAPAKIGWGSGSVPDEVFNRRWKLKPGTPMPNPFGGTDQVKMNPGVASPNLVEPAGPTDPEVSVLSVVTKENRPIALLANYSLHYVGGTGPGHISADYFGMFADRVQELLKADRQDPGFVGIMSNGTSGDINNINWRGPAVTRPKPYEKMREVAHKVAAEAVRVQQSIRHHDWVPLGVAQREIQLGVRKPQPAELVRAKDILKREELAKAKPGPLTTVEAIYARESVLLAEYPDQVPVILQAMRIGDLSITAIPCEVFVEIGLDLKKRSPLKPNFTISLANGYNGYLPTPEHHALGGYETWRARSSYLEVGASPRIASTLLELLNDLKSAK